MALSGNAVTITLGSSAIGGINNITFDTTLDQLDVTVFGGSGDRVFIAGLTGATMSLSGDYDYSDTNGQKVLVDAWKAKTLLTSGTQPTFTVNGSNGFAADGYVSGLSVNPTVEGKVTVSYSIQLTGAVTIS